MLLYSDGTGLTLVGNTSLTVSDDVRKSIVFHRGTMFADVTPQPSGQPMRVVTPKDSVQVLGTRFSLDATVGETDLSVSKGLVKLTRLQDGKSVEVPAGQRVVSNLQSNLELQAIPTAPVDWSEDFESGVPADWDLGRFAAADLPSGSMGAIHSVRNVSEQGEFFQICTPAKWVHGLFTVHEDSHLLFTFKMRRPGWINIFIGTRTDDEPPSFASN